MDEKKLRALLIKTALEGMTASRRKKASAASRAFGVSDETLDAIKAMDGATWTEDEYRALDDPFKGLGD